MKKSLLFIIFESLLFTVYLFTRFFFINEVEEVSLSSIKEKHTVGANETGDYILINTTVNHDFDFGSFTFVLNDVNTLPEYDIKKTSNDNLYVILTVNNEEIPLTNCFFKLEESPDVDENGELTYYGWYGNFVYGFEIPEEYKGHITSIAFHMWSGNTRLIGTKKRVITFRYTYEVVDNNLPNFFCFDCENSTISYTSYKTEGEIYDYFGNYFLSKCPCSGRGDETDALNVESNWEKIIEEDFITSSCIPSKMKTYMSNYTPLDSSSFSQAIERYDYIVFYKYGLEDFLLRGSHVGISQAHPNISNYHFKKDEGEQIIIIASVVASLSNVILLTFLINHKRNHS